MSLRAKRAVICRLLIDFHCNGQISNFKAKFRKFHKEFQKVSVKTFVQNCMPSKSAKTAKLYLASVMLCIPFIFTKMVKIPTSKAKFRKFHKEFKKVFV